MSNNKQLILDFWTNISWKELKGRLHFRVYGDRPVFVLNLDNVPYMIFNDGEMYQVVGDKEEPFTPRVKDDAGNRFTTQDIVQDCLERSARNETGDFEIEYACDVIQTYINAFKETVANDLEAIRTRVATISWNVSTFRPPTAGASSSVMTMTQWKPRRMMCLLKCRCTSSD